MNNDYLKDVNFNIINTNTTQEGAAEVIKSSIMTQSFSKYHFVRNYKKKQEAKDFFTNAKEIINTEIKKLNETTETLAGGFPISINDRSNWKNCYNVCFKNIKPLMDKELNSTAYILRTIVKSLVKLENNDVSIVFKFDMNNIKNITGLWKNDMKYFDLSFNNNPVSSSRLIMGFGPSAAGKTFMTKKIIELLRKVEPTFPNNFITIDGGIHRESSVIYQLIVKTCNENNIGGLNNLVIVNVIKKTFLKFRQSGSIFSSSTKEYITEYLQQEKNKVKISLYIPITLGSCNQFNDCSSEYDVYKKITDDYNNWVGLLIWQHKDGNKCPETENYKCKGCSQSGHSREITEGKKYSDSSYDNSIKYGIQEIQKSNSYKFVIHSTGGRKDSTHSIFLDFTTPINNNIKTNIDTNIFKYKQETNYDIFNRQTIATVATVATVAPTVARAIYKFKSLKLTYYFIFKESLNAYTRNKQIDLCSQSPLNANHLSFNTDKDDVLGWKLEIRDNKINVLEKITQMNIKYEDNQFNININGIKISVINLLFSDYKKNRFICSKDKKQNIHFNSGNIINKDELQTLTINYIDINDTPNNKYIKHFPIKSGTRINSITNTINPISSKVSKVFYRFQFYNNKLYPERVITTNKNYNCTFNPKLLCDGYKYFKSIKGHPEFPSFIDVAIYNKFIEQINEECFYDKPLICNERSKITPWKTIKEKAEDDAVEKHIDSTKYKYKFKDLENILKGTNISPPLSEKMTPQISDDFIGKYITFLKQPFKGIPQNFENVENYRTYMHNNLLGQKIQHFEQKDKSLRPQKVNLGTQISSTA